MVYAPFWKDVRKLRLSTNMRLLAQSHQMDPVECLEAENFANWLLQVGDGTATVPEEPNKVKIPQGTES
jgi:PIF1-like helicase